jgi:hypothetical protein
LIRWTEISLPWSDPSLNPVTSVPSRRNRTTTNNWSRRH